MLNNANYFFSINVHSKRKKRKKKKENTSNLLCYCEKYSISRHRPFSCFYWHFQNQRRRRPFRRKDGTFSYDPDFYCNDYDEQTGVCPNGDEYVE